MKTLTKILCAALVAASLSLPANAGDDQFSTKCFYAPLFFGCYW